MATLITYDKRHLLPDDRAIGIFNHIPKSGGAGLNARLAANDDYTVIGMYESSILNYRDLEKTGFIRSNCKADANVLVDFRPRTIVSGHELPGLHHLLPSDMLCFYFTFVRDPLNRAMSLIKFWKDSWPNTNYRNQLNISKFLYVYGMHMQENILIQSLGSGDKVLAEENLFHNYVFFGITEYYSESLLAMNGHVFSNFSGDIFQRFNWSSSSEERVYDEAVSYFIDRNKDDIELYQKACREFKRRYMHLISSDSTKIEVLSLRGGAAKELCPDWGKVDYKKSPFQVQNHIGNIVYAINSNADLFPLYQYLREYSKDIRHYLYWAFICANRLGLPDELLILGQQLFQHCSRLDPANLLQACQDVRLFIADKIIEKGLQNKNPSFRQELEEWLWRLSEVRPWQGPALHRLAKLHIVSGRLTEAEELLRRALTFKPDSLELEAELCQLMLRKGPEGAAELEARARQALASGEIEWALRSLACSLVAKKASGAAEALEAALHKNPYWLEGRLLQLSYLKTIDSQLALEAGRRGALVFPELSEFMRDFFLLLLEQSQEEEFIARAADSLKYNDHWGWLHLLLSQLHEKRSENELALSHARLAVSSDPAAAAHHLHLAALLIRQGLVGEAEKRAGEALAAFPKEAWPHASLALAHEARGELARALAESQAALVKQPYKRSFLALQARLLRLDGRWDQCEDFCRQALASDEAQAWAWRELCLCAERNGAGDKALEYGRRALELDPAALDFAELYRKISAQLAS